MRNIKKIGLLCVVVIAVFVLSKINAFDNNIGKVIKLGNPEMYNGHQYFYFKQANDLAAICTKYGKTSPAGKSVQCTIDDWKSDAIKGGVAAIIEAARNDGLSNTKMTKAYYFAELAINRFLYSKGGGLSDNRVSSKSTKAILTDTNGTSYYSYYEAGIAAYNRIKEGTKVSVSRISGKSINIISPTEQSITNVYKVSGDPSADVTVSATGVPAGTTITVKGAALYDIGGGKASRTFLKLDPMDLDIVVSGLQTVGTIKVKIEAISKLNYKVATRYDCGNGAYQPMTLNTLETETKTDSAKQSFEIKIMDEPTTVSYPGLQITKRDAETSLPLSGAIFNINKETEPGVYEPLETLTTGENGIAKYSYLENYSNIAGRLTPGNYKIEEIHSPSGYMRGAYQYSFKVNENGTIEETEDAILVRTDEYGGQLIELIATNSENAIIIYKTGKLDNVGLDGGKFKLTATEDPNSPAIVHNGETLEWTGIEKIIRGLPTGEYYLHELQAPVGYVQELVPLPIFVTDESTSAIRYRLANYKTSVKISKISAVTSSELPGATLQVLNKDKEKISCTVIDSEGNEKILDECSWVSGDAPTEIVGLPIDKYYLQETIAPKGYVLSKEMVEFQVNNNDDENIIKMINDLEVEVPDTLSSRSALLITIAMFDIALGIGILTYVKKYKIIK